MLDAPETFFLRGGNQFPISQKTSRSVSVIGIDSENDQGTYV